MTQPDWNERFADSEFAYGTEPNAFLAEHAGLLTGSVLSIAEGEGRNAVFLASRGLRVHAVDASHVGLSKASNLANEHNVSISTEVADLQDYEPSQCSYDAVVSIYAHLDSAIRRKLCPLLVQSLKRGGICILEAYSENQRGRGTGGPSDVDLLMTCSKIEREFAGLETVLLHETEREVCEGQYHTGMASVIQFIGRKRA